MVDKLAMKSRIKTGLVLAALAAAGLMVYQQKKRLAEIDAISEDEWDRVEETPAPTTRRLPNGNEKAPMPEEQERQEEENAVSSTPPFPPDFIGHQRPPRREYDAEFMQAFLSERRELEKLDSVAIGPSEHYVSKNYKALLLPAGEGKGYYRLDSWTIVPLDYNEEEGYPVLYNKNNRTVSILTGLVSVKMKDGVSLEKGMEMISQESGLEVDTVTRHLNIIHAKFYPVTGQSLKDYRQKLNAMGIFSRVEIETDRGGPYPN